MTSLNALIYSQKMQKLNDKIKELAKEIDSTIEDSNIRELNIFLVDLKRCVRPQENCHTCPFYQVVEDLDCIFQACPALWILKD